MSAFASLAFRGTLAFLVVIMAIFTQLETESDMLLADKKVSLSKSRATLFQYIAEMRNYPYWFPGAASFEPSDSEPMGIGKHYVEVQTMPIIGELHYDNLITAYESPHFVGFISNAWLQLRTELILERQDNPLYPALFNIKVYTRRRSYFVQYILGPLLRHATGEKVRQACFNLKFLLQK